MTLKLLTEHDLEFLSLKGGCTGSSKSTLVNIPHCWKSHVAAHLLAMQGWFLPWMRQLEISQRLLKPEDSGITLLQYFQQVNL